MLDHNGKCSLKSQRIWKVTSSNSLLYWNLWLSVPTFILVISLFGLAQKWLQMTGIPDFFQSQASSRKKKRPTATSETHSWCGCYSEEMPDVSLLLSLFVCVCVCLDTTLAWTWLWAMRKKVCSEGHKKHLRSSGRLLRCPALSAPEGRSWSSQPRVHIP